MSSLRNERDAELPIEETVAIPEIDDEFTQETRPTLAQLEALGATERYTGPLAGELPPDITTLPPLNLEMTDALKRLFPDMYTAWAAMGLSDAEQTRNVLENLTIRAQETPDTFLQDLLAKEMPDAAGTILRGLGATQQDIDEMLGVTPMAPPVDSFEAVINKVFPERAPADVADLLQTDWEGFIKEIQTGGYTSDKARLLRMIGLEDAEIREIIPPWWTVDYWLDAFFKPYGGKDLGGKAGAAFLAGLGDVINNTGGAARWLGFQDAGEVLSNIGSTLSRVAPPDTTGEFELADLLNPEYYATKVVRQIPFSLTLAPLGIAGYGAGAGLATALGLGRIGASIVGGLGGAALSRPLESAMEAGQAYDDAIARGKTEAEAKKEADEVFKNNMTLAGADAFEIAIALAPTPKWVPTTLVKSGLVRTARVAGKMVIVGLSEGGEEVYQDMVQRHARGEEWRLDPISKEVFAIGAVMGVGMGLGGDAVSGIVETAQNNMSAVLRARYNELVVQFEKQGFQTRQAKLRALDQIAQTPEGEGLVNEAIKLVKALLTEEKGGIELPGKKPAITPAVPEGRVDINSPEGYQKAIQSAVDWQYLTALKGEAATKTELDTWLRERYGVDAITARNISNETDVKRYFRATTEGLKWDEAKANRPAPTYAQYPELKVALPKAEVGMPEAGLQPSMLPEEVAAKEVRPVGKGKVTQISMEDQLKLEETYIKREIDDLKSALANHPARDLIGLIQKSGKERGELNTITAKQYLEVTGKHARPSILTPDGKHVRWELALDELATERGYADGEALREGILEAKGYKDRIAGLTKGTISPVMPEEEQAAVEEVAPPPPAPPPPPQSVTPPPPIVPQPMGGEITRIIAQSSEQVRQDKAGSLTWLFQRIPGIKQVLEFEQPGLKMTGENKKVLVAMVAENAARSDVSVWAMGTRMALLKDIRHVFGKDALRGDKVDVKFLGTPEQAQNPITGTLKDIADNPELYQLSNNQHRVLVDMEARNDQLLDWVVTQYNAEIGRFKAKEGGAFLPNVDVSEDVVEYLGSEMRAVTIGRGKPRIWQTARERMAHDKTFKPETDIQKLLQGLDNFKAAAAGGQTYRQAIGGLNRLEAMEKTHPALYNKMTALRKRLQSLRGSAGRLEAKLDTAIVTFLESPTEGTDLSNLRESLDVKLARGPRKGMDVEAIQNEIDAVKAEISELRPAWEAANLKPYVFIQEGLYRYFPSEQAKLIVESRKATNNPLLNFIEGWRGQSFSGDFSPFAIQGFLGVLANPWGSLKAGLGGVRTAIQTHDWLRSFKVEALAADISNNPYEFSQYASLMGRGLTGTPQEYAAGFLSKIPGFNKFTEATYITVTRGSFNLWQRTYKHMVKHGTPELEAKVAAANLASKVYPLVSSTRLGQSPARAAFLRAMPTSYSFIRQPVSLMAEAVRGLGKIVLRQQLTPMESLAVKTVINGAASTLAVSATSAALSALAAGGDDDDIKKAIWDAINPDPYNGKFCSIIVGDKRIPLGGPYRAIFRAIYPQEVPGVPIPLPFYGLIHYNVERKQPEGYLWNRITPAISTQIDLMMNKDYWGNPILKGGFFEVIARGLAYEFEGALPLTAGAGVEAIRQGDKYKENVFQQMIAQFMGVNLVTLDNTYLDRQIRQLGLPKDTEPQPYSIQRADLYNTKDLWGDSKKVIGDIPTEKVLQGDFDNKVKAIAQARDIQAFLETLPNEATYKINADSAKGDTFIEYYEQWKRRQTLLNDPKALAAFDAQYPKAYLGNMSQSEFVLLQQFHSLAPAGQKEFLKAHPELTLNKREEWLKSRPTDNARFAIWGQAKLLTQEAYNQFKSMARELDIPESALPPVTMPPETSVDTHIQYEQMVADGKQGSWEGQLLLKKDADAAKKAGVKSYVDWRAEQGEPLTLSDTPIASLELKTEPKFRELYNQLQGFSDRESPDYKDDTIKDKDGLTERDKAVAELKATRITGDTTFRDTERQIEAIEKGTNTNPIDDELVKAHIDYMRLQDEHGSSSAEAMLFRVDNPDYDKFRQDITLWDKEALKPVDQAGIPIWRIDVKYRKEDAEYDAIKNPNAREQSRLRDEYLAAHDEYRMDRRRREAYDLANEKTGARFPIDQIENYVAYNELPVKGKRQERFFIENRDFGNAMHRVKGTDWPDPNKVPAVQYDDIYDQYPQQFDEFAGLADNTSQYYIEDVKARAARAQELRFNKAGKYIKFGLAEVRREAYGKFVSEDQIDNYIGYYTIIGEGKPKNLKLQSGTDLWYEDDWFLIEHMDFYKKVYLNVLGNERRDFSKIPDRDVFKKYLSYIDLPHDKARDDYRRKHPDLDDWLVLKFKYTPIKEQKRREDLTTHERYLEDWDAMQSELDTLIASLQKKLETLLTV